MGRPPCSETMGAVRKRSWTPEEDVTLVSYIHKHGPVNWRIVPNNTGLHRSSKSCRSRWTNFLRPGINRGDFSSEEKRKIINLQAILGNRWAAIAAYLPQRTDSDVKNYWNNHIQKQLQKGVRRHCKNDEVPTWMSNTNNSDSSKESKGCWERNLRTNFNLARQALLEALSPALVPSLSSSLMSTPSLPTSAGFKAPFHLKWNRNLIPDHLSIRSANIQVSPTSSVIRSSTYVMNTENIARLLQNWMKETPISTRCKKEFNLNLEIVATDVSSFKVEAVPNVVASNHGNEGRAVNEGLGNGGATAGLSDAVSIPPLCAVPVSPTAAAPAPAPPPPPAFAATSGALGH